MFKIISDKRISETYQSLETQDISYVFKLIEYLDAQDYITETYQKDAGKSNK